MEHLVFDVPMLVAALILTLTFLAIFTEQVHHIERVKFAMLGAGTMLLAGQLFGFYDTKLALEAVDWNVVFLLGCMMAIVSIMIPTGGFEWLAFKIAHLSKGKLYALLVLTGTAVTVISLLLDNVTTVVIFGPLIIMICKTMKVSPIPYLLAAALLSDTGGVATLVGDPPNLIIGSAADIDFNTFFIHMGGLVFCAWIAILLSMKVFFSKELAVTPSTTNIEEVAIKEPYIWKSSMAVMLGMVFLFVFHDKLGWEPWVVSAAGLTALLFLARRVEMDIALTHVEIPLLIFFISLFILIGGVERSHLLEWVGQFIEPFVEQDLLIATLVLMWVSAILSALIDNIPFTAAMIPVLLELENKGVNVAPLWWGLSVGVGMGGNGTHVGSTANVFIVTISERLAKEQNDPSLAITPGLWARKGTPAMLLTLIVSSIIMAIFFDFFSKPLH